MILMGRWVLMDVNYSPVTNDKFKKNVFLKGENSNV